MPLTGGRLDRDSPLNHPGSTGCAIPVGFMGRGVPLHPIGSRLLPIGPIPGSMTWSWSWKLAVGLPDSPQRMTDSLLPIRSPRLSLVALTAERLALMRGDRDGERPFDWPAWWPDETDRRHVSIWRDRASASARNVVWGPRAVVDADNHMVGHAGFHLPPRPLAQALDDPTFLGLPEPGINGAVEIGYTIFPSQRGRGYATEAVAALVDWAAQSIEVEAVLATIVRGNDASVRVLERVGSFAEIGLCRNDDGEVEVVYCRDLRPASATR